MKIILIALFLASNYFIGIAQSDEIAEIRKAYYQLAERIAQCSEDGFTCGLYQNTLTKNVNGTSWSAVGIYRADIDFWYDGSDDGDGYNLQKVVIKSRHSDRTYTREFLYIEDELVFYYEKAVEEQAEEKRYYFKDYQLIKYMENSEIVDLKDKSGLSYTIEEGKSLLALFKASVGVGE